MLLFVYLLLSTTCALIIMGAATFAAISMVVQKTNGLNLAIVLLGFELGFLIITGNLIIIEMHQVILVAIIGIIHMFFTMFYFVAKLNSDEEETNILEHTQSSAKGPKPASRPGVGPNQDEQKG